MGVTEENAVDKHQILIVEDERDIASLLALHLSDANFDVSLAADGHEGMNLAFARNWDLIILDVRLPGPDGLTICRTLRREMAYVPILMLTSKSSELDRVLGLELGADDYVTKPFSVTELVARVKAIFRRIESVEKRFPGGAEYLSIGDLTIDTIGPSLHKRGYRQAAAPAPSARSGSVTSRTRHAPSSASCPRPTPILRPTIRATTHG